MALHLRFLPLNHFDAGDNKCPAGPVIQRQVDRVATKNKCLFVFSNDIKRARAAVTAPCVHYIDPGEVEIRHSFNEVHPIGDSHEVARDLAALTMCHDLITTCGTFGVMAAMLHAGNGSTYWWPQDPGLKTWKHYRLAQAWVPYA